MYPSSIGVLHIQEQIQSFIQDHCGAVICLDQNGEILEVNEAMCLILGVGRDQLLGQSLFSLLVCKQEKEAIKHALQFERKLDCLTCHLRFDFRTSIRFAPTMYRVESPYLERKCFFLHLNSETTQNQVPVFRQFSDSFMSDVNLGILLIDANYRLVDISTMACRILGIDRDQALNQTIDDIFKEVPIEHQFVNRKLLDGVVVRNHAVSWTNNQERYELLMDTNVLKDGEGKLVGAYVLFKDVTNLRSLEQQVRRSDRLAMIGQIAAGTAHEIRNPLTSIKGFLQMLKKSLYERDLQRESEYAEIMLSEIDRINELVSEFLLLSKPKDSIYQPVDVSSVIRDILPIINNEAILHDVTVQYESTLHLPYILGDRELLKQVCINISKNGIEAMSDGGELTIVERWDKEEQMIHIDIKDTGPGIPVFLIDKIFDPFFTTKEEGTGLGLSVCQRIIHDLNGTLRVSSKGYGTTFTISIPCMNETSDTFHRIHDQPVV